MYPPAPVTNILANVAIPLRVELDTGFPALCGHATEQLVGKERLPRHRAGSSWANCGREHGSLWSKGLSRSIGLAGSCSFLECTTSPSVAG